MISYFDVLQITSAMKLKTLFEGTSDCINISPFNGCSALCGEDVVVSLIAL